MIVGGAANVKPVAVAVPPAVVTETLPLVELPGTVAVIEVAELAVMVALPPVPKVTSVALDRLVPLITTEFPVPCRVGVKLEIEGAGMNVKPVAVAVPPAVVTETLPLVEPAGTVAVIEVAELAVTVALPPEPKVTRVGLARLRPVITTELVAPCEVGVKLEIEGAGTNVKPVAVAAPPAVVTETLPLVEPAGTVAVIEVAELAVTVALPPEPKVTRVGLARLRPVITTELVAPCEVGVKLEIEGAGTNVKPVAVAVPPAVVTEMLPLVEPAGTVAVIEVAVLAVTAALPPEPKVTSVGLARLRPVITTEFVAPCDVGVKLEIEGAGTNVKPVAVAVPPAVVTEMLPLVEPAGTIAVIEVGVLAVTVALPPEPKVTSVGLARLRPVITTEFVAPCDVGVKLAIEGAGTNVKPVAVAVPPAVVTEMLPLVEPAGTVAVIEVAELAVTVALPPEPKVTSVGLARLRPVITTEFVAPCDVGVKLEIEGAGTNVKPVAVAVPAKVVTVTLPLVEFAGTSAVIDPAVLAWIVAFDPAPKVTVAFERLVPLITTGFPAPCAVGVKLVMAGSGGVVTLNADAGAVADVPLVAVVV